MSNFSKVALFTAVASLAVFAQDDEDFGSSPSFSYSPAPSFTPAPVASSSPSATNRSSGSGPEFRFSGDIYLEPGFEFDNTYVIQHYENGRESKLSAKNNAFNMSYGWNANLGLDFNDNFSVDFRLSNPSGYALDGLAFDNGSVQGYWSLPSLPHAYFTWRTDGPFRLHGGLLNVSGNTTLDLVAGVEGRIANVIAWLNEDAYLDPNAGGLWTWYNSWDCEYNASQGGLKFGFDLSDNFALNLTTALVSSQNTLDYSPNHNEFRLVLDAEIGLGSVVTLSPIITTRSFWKQGYHYEYINGREIEKAKTPVLFAYGSDIDLEFNDMFSLNAGIALGHIRFGKWEYQEGRESGSGSQAGSSFLAKVAPSLNFGINEVLFQYSLGIGSFREKGKGEGEWLGKFTSVYNDMALCWDFRMNENIAFGPVVAMAFRTDKYRERDDYPGEPTFDEKLKIGGYSWMRFGLGFTASF